MKFEYKKYPQTHKAFRLWNFSSSMWNSLSGNGQICQCYDFISPVIHDGALSLSLSLFFMHHTFYIITYIPLLFLSFSPFPQCLLYSDSPTLPCTQRRLHPLLLKAPLYEPNTTRRAARLMVFISHMFYAIGCYRGDF